jgi:hypothetical protein
MALSQPWDNGQDQSVRQLPLANASSEVHPEKDLVEFASNPLRFGIEPCGNGMVASLPRRLLLRGQDKHHEWRATAQCLLRLVFRMPFCSKLIRNDVQAY